MSVAFLSSHSCNRNSEVIDITTSCDTCGINKQLIVAGISIDSNLAFADSIATIALEKSRDLKYPQGMAASYFILGYTAHLRNYNNEAIELLKKSEKIYSLLNDSISLIDVWKWLGLSYAHESEYQIGNDLIEKSLEYARIKGREDKLTGIFINKSKLFSSKGEFESAAYFLDSAEYYNQVPPDDFLAWKITMLKGAAYYRIGKYKEATEKFQTALKDINSVQDKAEVFRLYTYISQTYFYLKDYPNALNYQRKALNTIPLMHNKSLADYFMGYNYLVFGEIFNSTNQPDSAFYYLEMAKNNKELSKDLHAFGRIIFNIAESYYLKSDYKTALDLYNQCLSIQQKTKEIERYQIIKLGLAKSQLKLNMPKSAKANLLSIMQIDSMKQIQEVITEAAIILSQIYANEKNYRNAYKYMALHNTVREKLFNDENVRRVTKLDLEYSFQLKEQEINYEREQERTKLNVAIKQNKLIRNVVTIGLLLALLIAIYLYRNYQQKRKADNEKELLLKEIHHRVKNNLQVISSMLNMQSMYIKDAKIKEAIGESQGRVKSMALIHQMLYQNENLGAIDMQAYIKKLADTVSDSFIKLSNKINLYFQINKEFLNIDKAIPIGLIINELLTNAYKYAFRKYKTGEITISFTKKDNVKYLLIVRDNGCGMDKKHLEGNSNSLGMSIVKLLTRQLKGKIYLNNDGGTEFNIEIAV